MSLKSFSWHILLFLLSCIALADLVLGNLTIVKDDKLIESVEEIDDLNKKNPILWNSSAGKPSEANFIHRDEDMLADLKQATIFSNLKYDVEILESGEVKKDVEIEERYRGHAITLNTDKFVNENIEVNAHNEELEPRNSQETSATSHMILGIVLVVVALIVVGLYVSLVVWRRHIHQRYGMRELLVSSDNQDYWPQDVITSVYTQHQQQYQQRQLQLQSELNCNYC